MRTIQEISVFSQELIRLLGTKDIGDIVTYDELSQHIGVDIQSPVGRGYLNTARNRLCIDDGMVFDTVQNVGIKRMSDEEVALITGESYVKKTKKSIRRSVQKMVTVNYNNLSDTGRLKYHAGMTILVLNDMITSRRNVNKIENKVSVENRKLNQKEALKLIHGSGIR